MSERAPEVSVVIPTRNRCRHLEALLRSLADQEGPSFETIVVDDGSTDATPELLRRGVAGSPPLSIRHETSRGPAAARNTGWRAAQTELVAFLDDDVRADVDWLASLVEAHRREPGAILQGRTQPDPDELARSTVFWRSMRVEGPDPFAPACNIAYPRELLERTGGFDETAFTRAMGEDTDLALRARKTGADLVYVDGARARHAVHQQGLIGALRETRRTADMAAVIRRHPELRQAIQHRVFLERSHERVLGLVAGIALSRRTRGASLVLGVPYAALYRGEHRGWTGALLTLPAYAAVDLVRVLALAAASVRHRTLLL